MNTLDTIDKNILLAALAVGFLLSLFFAVLGVLVVRYRCYGLIAGYNRAPDSVKQQYDIEGLADHVGNGLISLGVLLAISSLLVFFRLWIWSAVFFVLFLFIVMIILIGSRKFMPARRQLAALSPTDAKHPFLHWLLSEQAFRAVESGTRQWLQECQSCGHKQDFWEAGGVRQGGIGEPRKLQLCGKCQTLRWQKIRRKTAQELEQL